MDANDVIQRGNEGIDIGAWTGAPTKTERAPLPGHEHTTPLYDTWVNLKETNHVR